MSLLGCNDLPAAGNADSPGHAGLGDETHTLPAVPRDGRPHGVAELERPKSWEILVRKPKVLRGVRESTEVALAAVCVDDNVRWPGDEATMEENRRDEDETGAEFKW